MQIEIKGRVQTWPETGRAALPVPRLLVQAWDNDLFSDDDLLGQATTGKDGTFRIKVNPEAWRDEVETPNVELYFRVFYQGRETASAYEKGGWKQRGEPPDAVPYYETVIRVRTTDLQREPVLAESGADGAREFSKQIIDNLSYLVAFQPGGGDSSLTTGSRPAEIETAVSDAARDLLGKRIQARDGKGLINALSRVIEFQVVDGHRVAHWRPPTYAVETELGAQLTGAQASLYQYASTGIVELRRRIDTLVAQGTDIDDDRINGARASFLAELDDLNRALGSESLRPIRIDGSLERLDAYLEEIEEAFDFDDEDGRLTVDDERAYTDFLIARQYLNGLKDAWNTFKANPDTTFGALLMDLERLLAVVTEAVDEIYAAMDRLDFDAAERRAVLLTFQSGDLSVAELFDWVLIFSGKAALVLKDGGRKALPRLCSEVTEIHEFVEELAENPPDIRALKHPRVTIAISELADYLGQVQDKLCFSTSSSVARP